MLYSLTLRDEHDERLRALVFAPSGSEGAAFLLCRTVDITRDPWNGDGHRKFLSCDVMRIAPEDLVSSSSRHINCKTRSLVRALKRAADEDLAVAFVHSHPGGFLGFSEQDDAGEPYLVELAQHRNGAATELLSLVMTPTGVVGRVWSDVSTRHPFDTIRVVGNRLRLHYARRLEGTTPEAFHRQALAFGPALNNDLAALRIGIVGAGGTGSATGTLLARLGVKRIVSIDHDAVDETNLSRLYGATMNDVRAATLKVEVMRRHLEEFGLGTEVVPIKSWAGQPECRDALKSCDVIFVCTDDDDGRMLLNRLAYFYLIPVIDMGIGIDPSDDDPPWIRDAAGRVTVLQPGTRCLLCRRVVNIAAAREDQLRRTVPDEYDRQRREGYVRGGDPAPAVVTFTTDVACMAVDELIHRLTAYRTAGSRPHRVRKYHLTADKRPGVPNGSCRVCESTQYWGRGDLEPFLDRTG